MRLYRGPEKAQEGSKGNYATSYGKKRQYIDIICSTNLGSVGK